MNNNSKFIILLDESLQKIAPDIALNDSFHCFVAKNSGEFNLQELVFLIQKHQSREFSGIEKHLCFPSIVNKAVIQSSDDKKRSIAMLEDFVLSQGEHSERFQEYAHRLSELADELLLNAIFSANKRFSLEDRALPFTLENNEKVEMKWGFDGEVFGISVTDPFGTLSKESVLEYINSQKMPHSICTHSSAGLGIKIIFERLHHFIVTVDPHKSTEIICLLRFEKKQRDFDNKVKSFHYFRSEEVGVA